MTFEEFENLQQRTRELVNLISKSPTIQKKGLFRKGEAESYARWVDDLLGKVQDIEDFALSACFEAAKHEPREGEVSEHKEESSIPDPESDQPAFMAAEPLDIDLPELVLSAAEETPEQEDHSASEVPEASTTEDGEAAPDEEPAANDDPPSEEAVPDLPAAPSVVIDAPAVIDDELPDLESLPDAPAESVDLISAFWTEENVRLAADEERLKALAVDYQRWRHCQTILGAQIDAAITGADLCLSALSQPGEELSDALKSRFRSVEVLRKMIGRLGEKARAIAIPEVVPTSLPDAAPLPEPEQGADIEKLLRAYEERENLSRYAVITEVRRATDEARKVFNGFVEKSVLPALDAIDDGIRFTTELEVEEGKEYVAELLAAYQNARLPFQDAFGELGVNQIEVEIGKPINFDLHEPFDLEEDLAYPENSVRSVFREGYVLSDGYVLRPAQVIIVRNGQGVNRES